MASDVRVALCVARFYADLADALEAGARDALGEAGVTEVDRFCGTRPQRALGVGGFAMHGKNKHRHLRIFGADHFQQFQTVAAGQRDIHDREVGAEVLDGVQRRIGFFRIGANREIGFTIDE